METITFRCTKCQSVLKVGADKAGRNAKCTKCGTVLTIPAAAAPPVAAAKKPTPEEDDASQGYLLKDLPDAEEEKRSLEKASNSRAIKTQSRVDIKRLAKITNPTEWRKVGVATRVIAGGLCVWLAAFLLYRVPIVIGLAVGPEYAVAAETKLLNPDDVVPGEAPNFNLCSYAVALVAGTSWSDTMIWVFRFALVISLLQIGPLVAGYVMCLAAPDRAGIRLQLMILFGLAFFNFLFLLVFKVLPMCGAYRFTILPLALPEVAMVEMNADRVETIFTFWLRWPVLEAFWSILVTLLYYLEPALIATLVQSVAVGIKSEPLEEEGLKAMKLGYSQLFIQLVWYMAAICGAGLVLLWILRLVYVIGTGFFIYQLIFTVTVLFRVAPVVEDQLGDEPAPGTKAPEDEDEFDDEDDEDDE